ncbi:MAG: hypothetical protein ABSC57_00355 [Syntrophales bacterium]
MTIELNKKGNPIGTERGLKVTAVVTSRKGKAVKFQRIKGLFILSGALRLIKTECIEKCIVTLDLARMKVVGVRL